jgi:fucose 4-O-acetylase-like acetyltransferase
MTTTIDDLVAATPTTRDRSVDFLRGVSIAVVVLWHWVFSITHWNDRGAPTMPNPIGDVPFLWLATWVLQIMPLFFFVGGFANFVSYRASRRRGESDATFLRHRLRRLVQPIAVLVAAWTMFEIVASQVWPSYTGVLHWGWVVAVPLWFIAVYSVVVCLAPLTARLHDRAPLATLGGLAALVAIVDVARFAFGIEAAGYSNFILVFAFVHQLGYSFGDGRLTQSRRTAVKLAATGFGALVLLTTFGPYSHSMVAVSGEGMSNMMPPNACIAALGVFQAGLALLARPFLNRKLANPRAWKVVIAVNAIAMTVFCWHMTAYVIAVGIWKILGHTLLTDATASWWWQRPLWVFLPGIVLAGLVRLFSRFENRLR